MPSQVLTETTNTHDESGAMWVQIPWSLLLIATERQDTTLAHNKAGVHANHMVTVEACDAQNLQI